MRENDMGTSWRYAILYLKDEQKQIAQELITEMIVSGIWPGLIVTEVVLASDF